MGRDFVKEYQILNNSYLFDRIYGKIICNLLAFLGKRALFCSINSNKMIQKSFTRILPDEDFRTVKLCAVLIEIGKKYE
jgi:hypothetical protein